MERWRDGRDVDVRSSVIHVNKPCGGALWRLPRSLANAGSDDDGEPPHRENTYFSPPSAPLLHPSYHTVSHHATHPINVASIDSWHFHLSLITQTSLRVKSTTPGPKPTRSGREYL
jgi:hypothetical protein